MPEKDTVVSLYIGTSDEGKAIVINNLRKDKGKEIDKPDNRYFTTSEGKRLYYNKKEIGFSNDSKNKGKNYLSIADDEGINIVTNKKLCLQADGKIKIKSNRKVTAESKKGVNIINGSSSINLNRKFNIYATSTTLGMGMTVSEGADKSESVEYKNSEACSYKEFIELNIDVQLIIFLNMNSEEIYKLVKNSSDSWITSSYDLITPSNAKDFVKIIKNTSGKSSFNLEWPPYGGYEPSTISSIEELSGKVPVSRDGGDGGYTMGIGKNQDGTYDNNSKRAIPKSSAEVNTGIMDMDLYKSTVDIVTGEGNSVSKIQKLVDIGIGEDIAEDLLKDYKSWLKRPEIVGENNISDGIALSGKNVNSKYGYYGKAAEWKVGDVKMAGGAGQMNTVYSWGTLRESRIITDIGKATIN
ncbi:MAG: hypothetical protein IJA34_09320 [Lachnospiraceae bacterium]|nr:hypothetical protein [Lachnospiraceae bacterium]